MKPGCNQRLHLSFKGQKTNLGIGLSIGPWERRGSGEGKDVFIVKSPNLVHLIPDYLC